MKLLILIKFASKYNSSHKFGLGGRGNFINKKRHEIECERIIVFVVHPGVGKKLCRVNLNKLLRPVPHVSCIDYNCEKTVLYYCIVFVFYLLFLPLSKECFMAEFTLTVFAVEQRMFYGRVHT